MSDIAERLRNIRIGASRQLELEAADEIDRLRTKLDQLKEHSGLTNNCIITRGEQPFYVDGDLGIIVVNLDKYAIVPLERYGDGLPGVGGGYE